MALDCGTATGFDVINAINANETSIGEHGTKINDIDSRVTTLESLHEGDYQIVGPINDIPETWTTINDFTMDNVKPGVYNLSITVQYTYSSTSSSAMLRLTVNGEVFNYSREPKDSTDIEVGTVIIPVDMTSGGDINVLIEAQKESGGPTLNIVKSSIICFKFI